MAADLPTARAVDTLVKVCTIAQSYCLRARVLYKKFVSEADGLAEYERWQAALPPGPPRPESAPARMAPPLGKPPN